jgi:CHASE2 domain-containing sensor protein/signal transduction histidine kinase
MLVPSLRSAASPARFGLTLAVLTALGSWILSSFGAFVLLDGALYDGFLLVARRIARPTPQVLLVEVDEPSFPGDGQQWNETISTLGRLGARLVVFSFLPAPEADGVYEAAAVAGNVVFGRPLRRDEGDPSRLKIPELPRSALAFSPVTGVVAPPPAEAGVHRRAQTLIEVDGCLYPSVELAAARRLGYALHRAESGAFLLSSCGEPGSLPNVAVERVLSGGLVRELVGEKCVLVGPGLSLPQPGLVTPTTSASHRMSLLEYQGHALNALVSGDLAYTAPPWIRIAVLLVLGLLGAFSFQWLELKAATWTVLGYVSAYIAAAFTLLVFGGIWFPPTEAVLTHAALFFLVLRRKSLRQAQFARRLLEESTFQLRDKYWPLHFYSSRPLWSLVMNMVYQTLDATKLIVLEADPRSKRLKGVGAMGCTLDDIVEKRRDFTRSPYSDAIQEQGPIKVRLFLKRSHEGEDQYLVPLLYFGELLGFWVLAIDAEKSARVPNFIGLVAEYSASLSELVYTRKEGEREKTLGRVLRSALNREPVEQTYFTLGSNLGLIRERLVDVEGLLGSLEAAVIVYDVFGRVVQVNEQMLGLLNREGLAPFDLTALDLVLALSDYDVSKARRLLRHVVVEGNAISFPVALRSSPKNRYQMHLKCIEEPGADPAAGVAGRKLSSRAILCELVETTALTRLYELKSRLTERLGLRLRNELATVDLSSSLLASPDLSAPERHDLSEAVHGKVQNTVRVLTDCQQYLALNADIDDLERFPVDARPALQAAIDEIRPLLEAKRVEIEVRQPSFLTYVLGSSAKIEQLSKAVLRLLCQDAGEQTTLSVHIRETEDLVVFELSNQGFGIPDDLLQRYVFGEQAVGSLDIETVREGVRWLEFWGGSLEARSGIGVGIRFSLRLVKFI